MKIVVLVKHVPDATADRTFSDADHTTDRLGVDGLLSELDEYAVEEALTIAEAGDSEVVVLTMGPEQAADALRKGLQMGASSAVHVLDDSLHGSDAVATSLVLEKAIRKVGDVDLILTGMASTDGGMSVVPAMLGERLGLPHVGFVGELTVADGTVTGRRDGDAASETIEAGLPAVVSVTDQINEPRYPSFKGIMAAKNKPVDNVKAGDLGLSGDQVGWAGARQHIVSIEAAPERQAGEKIEDEGDAHERIVAFLEQLKVV